MHLWENASSFYLVYFYYFSVSVSPSLTFSLPHTHDAEQAHHKPFCEGNSWKTHIDCFLVLTLAKLDLFFTDLLVCTYSHGLTLFTCGLTCNNMYKRQDKLPKQTQNLWCHTQCDFNFCSGQLPYLYIATSTQHWMFKSRSRHNQKPLN